MDLKELNEFLENHPEAEWAQDDDGNLYLRHTIFDRESEMIKVEPQALAELTPAKLEQVMVNGRNVEQITRITGYFSKVSGWNKGKRGELAQRQRVKI
jgi:hypothetical protein